jgi:hypothetical protein
LKIEYSQTFQKILHFPSQNFVLWEKWKLKISTFLQKNIFVCVCVCVDKNTFSLIHVP